MTLVKFANGPKRNSLNPLFNDVFDSFFKDSSLSEDRFALKVPAVNIAEAENAFHIELAVPGLKKEDFKIALEKNLLTISADKKVENADQTKKYSRLEYSYSSFSRSFTLPESADAANIEAEYTDGVLKIDIAKKEEAKQLSKEIVIK